MFSSEKETKTQYKEIMNQDVHMIECKQDGLKYPSTVQHFQCVGRGKNIHPTQKPVELMEYLIKTYTNENELILDNCMGSGSTAIACINTKRNYIGFELDENYYSLSNKRIQDHLKDLNSAS